MYRDSSEIISNEVILVYGFKFNMAVAKEKGAYFARCEICEGKDSYIYSNNLYPHINIFRLLEPILNSYGYTLWINKRDIFKFLCSPPCLKKILPSIPENEFIFHIGTLDD